VADRLLPPRVRRDAADGQVNFDKAFGIGSHDAFEPSNKSLDRVSVCAILTLGNGT
jgi:hypothetical protein